jgi:hypothetical protein
LPRDVIVTKHTVFCLLLFRWSDNLAICPILVFHFRSNNFVVYAFFRIIVCDFRIYNLVFIAYFCILFCVFVDDFDRVPLWSLLGDWLWLNALLWLFVSIERDCSITKDRPKFFWFDLHFWLFVHCFSLIALCLVLVKREGEVIDVECV